MTKPAKPYTVYWFEHGQRWCRDFADENDADAFALEKRRKGCLYVEQRECVEVLRKAPR